MKLKLYDGHKIFSGEFGRTGGLTIGTSHLLAEGNET
jgi:hypothetical protein